MIKGLDTGYLYTKDNLKHIFKSAYSEVNSTVTGSHEVEIDGKTYYVGNGQSTVEVNKINSELTKVCILSNLAMEADYEFKLVVGLPIKQYTANKDSFRDTVASYNDTPVSYNGKHKRIQIRDVIVFPQGAAAYYSMDKRDSDYILVDLGGLTIDVAYIEQVSGKPSIQKADTWYKGMLTLFSDVIEQVNSKYELTLDPYYSEKILTKGLEIYGEKQSTEFLVPVIKDYIKPIINELRINYPSATVPVYLCGGGANLLYSVFKRSFPNCTLMQDSQFSNAIGMYQIGQKKWGVVNV